MNTDPQNSDQMQVLFAVISDPRGETQVGGACRDLLLPEGSVAVPVSQCAGLAAVFKFVADS